MENSTQRNNWKWQVKNSVRYFDEDNDYEVKIPPYYQSLIDNKNEKCPIKKQCIPSVEEKNLYYYENYNIDINDSLGEEEFMPVNNLIHRYNDRALLIVTNQCFMNCRFCTRKRVTNRLKFDNDLKAAFKYLRTHKEIRDVIVSGGDPLTLDDNILEKILISLREIKHIEILRIGTRTPVVMPMRITESLVNLLKKYKPIWINTHFNSYTEITNDAKVACRKLIDAGITLANQSVLLKGVNDNVDDYKKLCIELVKIGVKPYYLYQCDIGRGINHFRTKIQVGMEIIDDMRRTTTGLAIPEFVIDSPNGGKIRIQKNNIVSIDDKKIVFKNYEEKKFVYPQGT